jgi:hypothetical protein
METGPSVSATAPFLHRAPGGRPWNERHTGEEGTRMRTLTILSATVLLLACGAAGAEQPDSRPLPSRTAFPPEVYGSPANERNGTSRAETLWIFDADFEDFIGDNAGWTSEDRSGSPAIVNHWHKDTIRINGFTHLGDSTWWCGTYNACWRQPRGYGNNWSDILVRSFPEVAANTDPGDALYLVYDQRYAMENEYDYGYTEISTDGGGSWATVWAVDNPGFAGTPGISQDWDSIIPSGPGHMILDISDYAGLDIDIRFRFESDAAYSSET